jgi:ribosomal-protein-alanine N-acetyltransferase
MELKTKRLCLRPISRMDLGAVLAYACDRSNAEYMVYYPKTEQEAVSYVEETASQWESEDQITYEFAVILAGEMIGTVSLWLEEADGVEIGWILNRNYWGRGYGTEAAEAVLRFMTEELGISSCISCCDTRNTASARMMEKLGMTKIRQRPRIYERRKEDAQEYVYQWTV